MHSLKIILWWRAGYLPGNLDSGSLICWYYWLLEKTETLPERQDKTRRLVQNVSYTGKLFLMTSVANWQQKLRNASVRGFFLTYCLIGLPAYLLTETNKWKSILSMSSDF